MADIKTKQTIEPKVLNTAPKQQKEIKAKGFLTETMQTGISTGAKFAIKETTIKSRQTVTKNMKDAMGSRQEDNQQTGDIGAVKAAKDMTRKKSLLKKKTLLHKKRNAKDKKRAAGKKTDTKSGKQSARASQRELAAKMQTAKKQYQKKKVIKRVRSPGAAGKGKSAIDTLKKVQKVAVLIRSAAAVIGTLGPKIAAVIVLFLLLSVILMVAAGSGGSDENGEAGSGEFTWPVPGYMGVSSDYGWRICPFHGKEFHTGIDIPAPGGIPVVAADGGRVIYAGYLGSYGNAVLISHGGDLYTLYAHNSSFVVKSGAVKKGQTIAKVGSTGSSTGNHLHFEVRSGGSGYGNDTSPWKYLNKKT